jgi:hypothetical protein
MKTQEKQMDARGGFGSGVVLGCVNNILPPPPETKESLR